MEIRKAEQKDNKDLVALLKQLDDYHFESIPNTFKKLTDEDRIYYINEWVDKPNKYFMIAQVDSRVVGLITAEVANIENHDLMLDKKYMKIERVVVDSKYRRQGIATKLLEHIEKISIKLELDFIDIGVWDFNPAKKVYEKFGFKTTLHKLKKDLK